MGYPYGIAPDGSGNGLTPAGLQTITAAEYGNVGGRISGCKITKKSTMAYDVGAGAVVVMTGSNLAVKVPVEAVTVSTIPAPSTGSRTDYIVVSTMGAVSVVQAKPASGTIIAEFNVPAGITGTTGASQVADSRFAMPIGTPMGPLVPRWSDPAGQGALADPAERTIYQTVLPLLPTDRWVEVRLTQAIYANAGKRGSMRYTCTCTNVAGPLPQPTELAFDEYWAPKQFVWGFWLLATATPATLTIARKQAAGDSGYHFAGGTIDVLDRGGAH